MLILFQYLLKIFACFAVIYFFYRLFLNQLTNYKSNRFYFLVMLVFAFLIPLLRPNIFIGPGAISASAFISYIPSLNITASVNKFLPAHSAISIPLVLLIIFISGIAVCLTRFLLQLMSLRKITSEASLMNITSGVHLYHLDLDIVPFSFGKTVYVNKHRHTAIELNDIIKHEAVHVNQLHIIDILLAELVCILNWYNPFVWLIKRAVKQNLEFLADDAVINNGTDKKYYQYLLLKVTGYSPVNIVSSFNLSSLKQRIYMMNKTKTSGKHVLKLLLVLPLIIIIMFAFRNSNESAASITTVAAKEDTFMLSELTYNIPDEHVESIVKNARNKSLLQVGKLFTIKSVINERDRIKTLLEKNGYNNIGNHAIVFMLDSSLANNHFAVQVNIDITRKSLSYNNTNQRTAIAAEVKFLSHSTQTHYQQNALLFDITEQQLALKT